MDTRLDFLMFAAFIGVGATAVMDLWALCLKRGFGIPSLNYGMVGRWIGHFRHGTFSHDAIGKAAPIPGEQVIGWSVHYAIGILFAALFLGVYGLQWVAHPTLLPALIIGILSLAAPFFILQPGMGAGIAASKTPRPNIARLRSLGAHLAFGVGLYIAALGVSVVL